MDTENLIILLEKQLKESSQATDVYKIRLQRTINHLKAGFYQDKDEILIVDLESLGFADVGRQIRRGLYI